MFFLSKRANLATDGMNSIFNIVTTDPKEQFDLWNTNITTNMRTWERRKEGQVLPRKREYVSVEQPLTVNHWQGFPIDFPEVRSMFIMRHPIDRLLSGDANMPRNLTTGKKSYGDYYFDILPLIFYH